MEVKRYFVSQDRDCHWCVIPVDKRVEWEAWVDLPDDNPHAAYLPTFAKEVGGDVARVTFTDPFIP